MYYYRLYGMLVESDVEFIQLVKAEKTDEESIKVIEGDFPDSIWKDKNPMWEFGPKESWLTNSTCTLYVTNGDTVSYKYKDGAVKSKLQSYVLGFGMAMIALQRNILAVHCSALADEKGALLIAGESGAGKSTLTASFLKNGYRLMADDVAWVEPKEDGKSYAKPAFPFQKLVRGEAVKQGYDLDKLIYINEQKDKFLVPYEGEFKLDDVPIKGFIYLYKTAKDEVVSEIVDGINKLYIIPNNLFLRHFLGKDKYAPQIGAKSLQVAGSVPIIAIGRPDGKDTSKEVIEKAVEFAQSV